MFLSKMLPEIGLFGYISPCFPQNILEMQPKFQKLNKNIPETQNYECFQEKVTARECKKTHSDNFSI